MLREVQGDDLADMRRWRNHPRVRAASFTTHEITEDEHLRWWEAVRTDPGRRVLIYDHHGVATGVVTYSDLTPESATWGYYLDLDTLERQGSLLRAWIGLEQAAVGHAFGPLGLSRLRGEVLDGNEPVMRLHRRFGFVEVGRRKQVVDGVPREAVTFEIRKEER
ncbi:GNAT family N-acetyltransferase [Nonomuraea sp. NPDC050202]|uniref:GNAT family N-acetyltransferase n=1 Tax=Nonomuraea sp. NPDC050202 TaxID=3155035 RepID=UPI0033C74E67